MHWRFAFISFILILGTVVALFFAYLGWLRRHEKSSYAFVLMMLAISVWSFSYAMEQFTPSLEEKIFWHKSAYLGISFVPLAWFIFNAQITGFRFAFRPLWMVLLSIGPTITLLLTWTLEFHELMWGDLSIGTYHNLTYLALERTPGFFIFVGYSYLLLTAGTILYLRILWRSPSLDLQTVLILFPAIALPYLLNILRILFGIDPFHPYDLTPIALTTIGTTAGWFTFRFGPLDVLSIARDALLESMRDGVIILDISHRIASANRSAQKMVRQNLAEMSGQPLETALPEIARQLYSSLFESAGAQSNRNLALRFSGTDRRGASPERETKQPGTKEITLFNEGEIEAMLVIDLSISYLYDRRGRPKGTLLVLRDITQRKKTQEALIQAQRMESIGLLAGGVAHDFNNLLGSMAMRHQLALMNMSDESPAHRHITIAAKTVDRAADLTRQILAYTGKGNFKIELLDLNRLICENEAILETAVPKSITLSFELSTVPVVVKADQGQLQQVIMNLLLNATEAIPQGKGHIQISTGLLYLDAQEVKAYIWRGEATPGEYVYLTVLDSGVGMSADVMARIFDPFFTTKDSGRGLGLSGLMGIVHVCDGAISVQSRPGLGTTFSAIFPASEESLPPVPAAYPIAKDEAEPQKHQSTILIVDDEKSILEALIELFGVMGFQPIGASNGQEAVAIFETHAHEIELVLLDTQMPVMGGLAALTIIRGIDSQVPVLIASGYSQTSLSASVTWDERTDFIQKPADFDQLLKKVERLISLSNNRLNNRSTEKGPFRAQH